MEFSESKIVVLLHYPKQEKGMLNKSNYLQTEGLEETAMYHSQSQLFLIQFMGQE